MSIWLEGGDAGEGAGVGNVYWGGTGEGPGSAGEGEAAGSASEGAVGVGKLGEGGERLRRFEGFEGQVMVQGEEE